MASKSADNSCQNSDHDSKRETKHASVLESDDHNQLTEDNLPSNQNPDAGPELTSPQSDETLLAELSEPANAGDADGEELLEMLEQLSETIDTAHNVLAEQQVHSSEAVHTDQSSEFEEHVVGLEEQASGLDYPSPPPPPPITSVAPSGWRVLIPAVATTFGIFFSIAALAALWLFWNSPGAPDEINLAKEQDRITGTTVSRSAVTEKATATPASEPVKPLVPLQSLASATPRANPVPVKSPEPVTKAEPAAKPAAPLQSQATATAVPAPGTGVATKPVTLPEPPAKTAVLVEPAVEVTKDTPEPAAIAEQKAPALPPLGKEEEARFLKRGNELISSGDVASARLALEYAAQRGSADAMFALAQTYDLEVLATWNVFGIEPDSGIALEWYGRAAQKGHDPADARASELEKLINR